MDSTRTYISVKRITGTSYFKCADVDGMLDEEACMRYGVTQGNGELAPRLYSQLASLWQRGLGKKKNNVGLFFKSLNSGEDFTPWVVFSARVSTPPLNSADL